MISTTLRAYATRAVAGLALAALLALPLLASSMRSQAKVPVGGDFPIAGAARVIDGDTIAIGDQRIRLEGIDAPEASQRCAGTRGDWPCGQAAASELVRLVAGRQVHCESKGRDKYGRVLGLCFADGVELNAEMVRRGLAWAFVRYSTAYVGIEAEARASKTGVWQGEAQPAWEYRAARWASAGPSAPEGCAIKGNVTRNGRIYHMPWSPWYDQIRVEPDKGKRWFCTEAEALAAGWRPVRIR
jgi:endonuclease YncB( thermonuclease family)